MMPRKGIKLFLVISVYVGILLFLSLVVFVVSSPNSNLTLKETQYRHIMVTHHSNYRTEDMVPDSQVPLNFSKWPQLVMNTHGQWANSLLQYIQGFIAKEIFPTIEVSVTEKVHSHASKVFDPSSLSLPVTSEKFLSANKHIVTKFRMLFENGDFHSYFIPGIQKAVEDFRERGEMSILTMEVFHYELLQKYRDMIRKKVKFNKNLLSKAEKTINEILLSKFGNTSTVDRSELVSFHIRRNDLVLFSQMYFKHGLPDKKFYNEALDIYRRRLKSPLFVVSTDDENHARQELGHNPDVIIKDRNGEGEDLAFMASCSHFILTVGTFGFLPAYLSESDVVYPTFENAKPSIFKNVSDLPTLRPPDFQKYNFKKFVGIPI